MALSIVFQEDFAGSSLPAGWVRRGIASETIAGGTLAASPAGGQGWSRTMANVNLAADAQDFELEMGITVNTHTGGPMLGLQAFDSTGLGATVGWYGGPAGLNFLAASAYGYGSSNQLAYSMTPVIPSRIRLRRSGNSWYSNYAVGATGTTWQTESASWTRVVVVDKVGFGDLIGSSPIEITDFIVRAPAIIASDQISMLSALALVSSVRLIWPTFTGALSYDYRVNGGSVSNTGSTTPEVTIGSLTNGTSYTFEVRPKGGDGTTGTWRSVRGTPTANVYLHDTFTRADSTTLLGTPDVGGPYTVRTGTWGISGNRGYQATAVAGHHVTWPSHIDADLSLTQVTKPDATHGMGLIHRYVDANNYWTFGVTTGGGYVLAHFAAGSPTIYWSTAVVGLAGDRQRAVFLGRQIYCLINEKIVFQMEDGYFTAATAVSGFRESFAVTTLFDDVHTVQATVIPGEVHGTPAEVLEMLGVSGTYPPTPTLYKGRDTAVADGTEIP